MKKQLFILMLIASPSFVLSQTNQIPAAYLRDSLPTLVQK